jgi:hypothetical protein
MEDLRLDGQTFTNGKSSKNVSSREVEVKGDSR